MPRTPITIVEVPPFPSAAEAVWSEEEKAAFIDYIARNPLAGDVIAGTGGIRKIRWTRAGMGKRGGARVIYFFHSPALPIFLITLYAKNVMDNITEAQKRTMAQLVDVILSCYGRN